MKNKVSPGTDCRQGGKTGTPDRNITVIRGKNTSASFWESSKESFSPTGAVDSLKSEHCFEHSGMSGKQLLMCGFISILNKMYIRT